jgi:hypothetical protein
MVPYRVRHILDLGQCCESGFIESGSGISSESGSRVLMTKTLKKYSGNLSIIFFNQKLLFTSPLTSVKDVQATGEAFSPQKRTSSTTKKEIY